jgi:hypothetical protein
MDPFFYFLSVDRVLQQTVGSSVSSSLKHRSSCCCSKLFQTRQKKHGGRCLFLGALKWIPVALGNENNCVSATEIFIIKTSNLVFVILTRQAGFNPHAAWLLYYNTTVFNNKIHSSKGIICNLTHPHSIQHKKLSAWSELIHIIMMHNNLAVGVAQSE